jgi:tetratricopeptide (TPR) repeat protein
VADRLLVDVSADGLVSVSSQLDGGLPDAPGDAPVELAIPLDAEALEDLRWYLEDYLIAPFGVYSDRGDQIAGRLSDWGTALFDAVFGTGPGRDVYTTLRARTATTELIVRSPLPAVLGLPWELLRDPARPTPLALDLAGMSRSLPGEGLPAPQQAAGELLRVLMVIARPRGADDVGYRMVARPLLQRLDAVRGQVELVVLRPPTLDALQQALRLAKDEGRPFQVVHFDGHGVLAGRRAGSGSGGPPHMFAQPQAEGFLQFESSAEDSGLVSAAQFAVALKAAEVPLVVLNACQSAAMSDQVEAAVATRLLQEGMAAVVAMGYSIYAVAAAEFMAAFYERLFAGDGVTAAVVAGRRRLFQRPLRPSPKGQLPLQDWMVPVHYLRHEIQFPQLVRQAAPPGKHLSLDQHLDQIREDASSDGQGGLAAVGEFVGRDAETYELERLARARRVVVVHGPGGSGKTELAKAFGRWWRDTGGVDQAGWIVWHSFEPGVATFGLDGALAAIGLQLFGADFARLDSANRRAVVVNALRSHRALVIWDNFETVHTMPDPTNATPPLDDVGREELRSFLAEIAASGGKSAVLVTSRTPETWLGDLGRFPLGGLGPADRADYTEQLLDDSPIIGARRAEKPFGDLLEWLDGHPLSMRLVLPHLTTTGADVLLGGLQGTHPLRNATLGPETRTTSLAASIAYSFDHLPEHERSLLVVLSLFQGVADADVLAIFSTSEAIPDRFRDLDAAAWTAVLDHAAGLGLLTSIGSGMYEIQPALPTFLATLWQGEHPVDHDDERARSTDALLAAYGHLGRWLRREIQTGNAPLAFAVIDRHHRALGHYLGYAIGHGRWTIAQRLAEPLSYYWDVRGLAAEANAWITRVRNAIEAPDGSAARLDEPSGALWLFLVGEQASRSLASGDPNRAEQIYTQLLEMLEEQPAGPQQQRHMAAVVHQLGMVAEMREELDNAEGWYRRSLTIEEALGNRPGQATSYHHLGTVAQRRGRLDDAEHWYRRSLTIKEHLGDRPGQARSYHQLGIVAQDRGQLDDAEHWYRRSLAIEEDLGDRPGQARSYHQLGIVAQDRGQLDDAEYWYRRSLTIKEHLGNQPGMAATFGQLGLLSEERDELHDALRWTVRCVTLFDEFPHPATGPGPGHLARLAGQLGATMLEGCWREVTGGALPDEVRAYVARAIAEGESQSEDG